MRKMTMLCVVVAMMAMLFGQNALAQPGGQRGQRGGQGGGRGVSMVALAAIEAVQAELDMMEDQAKDVAALQEKLQADRGTQGRRGQGNADMTDEEIQKQREERRAQAAEMSKKEVEGLKEILVGDQFARLHEIYVQALGVAAFQDEEIAKELGITEAQQTEMQEVSTQAREASMEEFAKLRDSGDRDAMQKRMTEMRAETEAKVMKVLTDKQKSSFEKMKGEPFEIPAGALRGGQRGGGQRGGGQRGGGQPGGGGNGN